MKMHASSFRGPRSRQGLLEKSILIILSLALFLWTVPASIRAADDGASTKASTSAQKSAPARSSKKATGSAPAAPKD